MLADVLYQHFDTDTPALKQAFDVRAFILPILISPLVFMPLAVSLQNANLDLSRFDAPRLMVFLVAFENGFLWRGYLKRRLTESRRGKR